MKIHCGILGAGGFAREVMPYFKKSAARSLNCEIEDIETYFVETWEPSGDEINGLPLISLEKFLKLSGQRYYNVAVADGKNRYEMVKAVGSAATALEIYGPQTMQLANNLIGEGAIFCPNSMVTSNAKIGRFFQANIYSYVAHDCVIGDFVTFAPGVRCNGRVYIDDYAYIGTNAVIREGSPDKPILIGAGAVIGMGAVVTKDVPAGAVVVGNPAKPISR